MNCVALFQEQAHKHPDRLALVFPGSASVSFQTLALEAARLAAGLRARGLGPGDHVLLFVPLSSELYASVIACLSIGATVLLVEPWMPLSKIAHVVEQTQPKIFVTGLLGRLWGLRLRSVRNIPVWVSTCALKAPAARLNTTDVSPDLPGILTFTSGTTGPPKGVVRTQQYLLEQHRTLATELHLHDRPGPDLCIFANFALSNLAAGRTSLIVPPSWSWRALRQLSRLPRALQPVTTTCGPAFLQLLLRKKLFPSLQAFHVGGALIENSLWKQAFAQWPGAHFTHVYGGTEAEPVACVDAREAVRLSEAEGFFHSLCVGTPVASLQTSIEGGTLWISGPHVCPAYFGDHPENKTHKRTGQDGKIWHCMGDRIEKRGDHWYYLGRSEQARDEFLLEQRIYAKTGVGALFVHRTSKGRLILVGDLSQKEWLRHQSDFPEIDRLISRRIVRDRRHRARIDRYATLGARGTHGAEIEAARNTLHLDQ